MLKIITYKRNHLTLLAGAFTVFFSISHGSVAAQQVELILMC